VGFCGDHIRYFITGNLVMGGDDDVHLRKPYCLSYLGWSVFNLFLCDLRRGAPRVALAVKRNLRPYCHVSAGRFRIGSRTLAAACCRWED